MRKLAAATVVLSAACYHPGAPGPAPATEAAGSGTDAAALCSAQRAENLRRATAPRCLADDQCVQAGRYVTGSCDAWVAKPEADEVLHQMRAATDAACQELRRVFVGPTCSAVRGVCVHGRCAGEPTGGSPGVSGTVVTAVPADGSCLATALQRVTAESSTVRGKVRLRFPLATDGRPPQYFEAVGPHEPDTALGVARALGTCRWRVPGGAIPPDAWGIITIEIRD